MTVQILKCVVICNTNKIMPVKTSWPFIIFLSAVCQFVDSTKVHLFLVMPYDIIPLWNQPCTYVVRLLYHPDFFFHQNSHDCFDRCTRIVWPFVRQVGVINQNSNTKVTRLTFVARFRRLSYSDLRICWFGQLTYVTPNMLKTLRRSVGTICRETHPDYRRG